MIPTHIKLIQKSRILELTFDNGEHFDLPCQYLRMHSPSAETRGQTLEQKNLQLGNKEINIIAIEPVGNYAVKLIFDDGHRTGIYSWEVLHELGVNYKKEEETSC